MPNEREAIVGAQLKLSRGITHRNMYVITVRSDLFEFVKRKYFVEYGNSLIGVCVT